MPVPLNEVAETIVKLQFDADSAAANIAFYHQQLAAAKASIIELEPLAEWGSDPVEPEPTV